MNTRYIRRFSLPERLYTAKSPVIIRAGALLEDTQTPRLVVQLKIMNISQKPVSSVGVHIRSFSEDGTETGGTEFYYRGLRAKRGQSSGNIPLSSCLKARRGDLRLLFALSCSATGRAGTVRKMRSGCRCPDLSLPEICRRRVTQNICIQSMRICGTAPAVA